MQDHLRRAGAECGLDGLRLYLDRHRLTRDFVRLRLEVHNPYCREEDYRPFGLPFVLIPPFWRQGRKASLALDFSEVGRLSAAEIVNSILPVIDGDPIDLRVAAADFTADWIGGTVSQCRRSLNVPRKRRFAEYENRVENEPLRAEYGKVETLYFGSPKSPDFYRVYDKAAEQRSKGSHILRPWVRVERRLSRRCLPEQLRTLRGLFENGASYEPFNTMVSTATAEADPARFFEWKQGTPSERRRAVYLQVSLNDRGRVPTQKMLAAENRKPHEEFALLDRARADLSISAPDIPNLNLLYQRAFVGQMWPGSHEVPSDPVAYNHCAGRGKSPQ